MSVEVDTDVNVSFGTPSYTENKVFAYPYVSYLGTEGARALIGPNFRSQLSGNIERAYDTTTWASTVRNQTESIYNAAIRMTPPLLNVKEAPKSTYDAIFKEAYLSYVLKELNQTFSKRVVLAMVGLRLDTGRAYTSREDILETIVDLPMDWTEDAWTISPWTEPAETVDLVVSFDRGQTFDTQSPKVRNLTTSSSTRNDREIVWRGLGSGNAMTLRFNYDSKRPTQIYAIDYSLV